MSRITLPQRRTAETFEFEHASDRGKQPMKYTATVGRYPDGAIGEVFLNAAKLNTDIDVNARDGAVAISLAVQHGCSIETLRHAMTRNADGEASGPLGALLDQIT
jgi:hypothetical protein